MVRKTRVLGMGLGLLLASSAWAGGAETFATYCAACHGAEGKGDGAAAVALPVKPANFADAEFWKTRDDAHLKKVITEGGAAVGKSPLMAPWGGALKPAQIDEVIAYLKVLGGQ